MSSLVDRPGDIRKGENLDRKRLSRYLRSHFRELGNISEVKQFLQGHSNLTYLIRIGEQEFVLRRPPFGTKVKSAHDMGREFRILSSLNQVYRLAPKPLLYCEDDSIIGAPFFLMKRVSGVILRNRAPDGLSMTAREVRNCCEEFINNLAELHGIDYRSIGLETMKKPGQYTERQINGWARRYYAARTDHVHNLETSIVWLRNRIPPDTDSVIIHNDYKFDNLVLNPENLGEIRAVLDWEMATIGDPMMDLGTTLAYWAEPGDRRTLRDVQCFLTTWPGSMSRIELAEQYAQKTGRSLENVLYYYVYGLVKVAVIVQQIYYRYVHGYTRDERFASMIRLVHSLGTACVTAIEKNRISNL